MSAEFEVDHDALPRQHGRVAGIVGVSVTEPHDQRGMRADDEDTAAVLAILTALAAASGADEPETAARSVWADPAWHLRSAAPSATGWWASGLPR